MSFWRSCAFFSRSLFRTSIRFSSASSISSSSSWVTVYYTFKQQLKQVTNLFLSSIPLLVQLFLSASLMIGVEANRFTVWILEALEAHDWICTCSQEGVNAIVDWALTEECERVMMNSCIALLMYLPFVRIGEAAGTKNNKENKGEWWFRI